VFVSERGTPLSIRGFQAMVERRSKAGAGRQPVLLRCYERSLVRRALDHRKDADPEHTDRNKIIRRETIDNGRNIPEWFIEQFMKAVEWPRKARSKLKELPIATFGPMSKLNWHRDLSRLIAGRDLGFGPCGPARW
jgi:hypothetical protein